MSQRLELLVQEFGEVEDSDWPLVETEAIRRYATLLKSYPSGPVDGTVSLRNIGKGADWLVVVLGLGTLFFAIPSGHKKIRESLEEWRRIYKELKALITWLVDSKPVIHPDQYLFLVALFSLAGRKDLGDWTYIGFNQLPENNPDLADKPPLLFSFMDDDTICQVAVGRNGHVIWENQLSVRDVAHY